MNNNGEEESLEDLIDKYSDPIKEVIDRISDLELYLKAGLRDSFQRISGAWEQYKQGDIETEGLITSGLFVLREKFINLFLGSPPRVEDASIMKEPQIMEEDLLKAEPQIREPPSFESPFKVTIPTDLFSDIEAFPKKELKEEPPLPPPLSEAEKKELKRTEREISIQETPKEKQEYISTKIEHVAPQIKPRSHRDAQKVVDIALDKINLKPMQYDKISDSELKSVNVGATLPGTPLVDEFIEVRNLIYKKEYDEATNRLEEIKDMAEEKGLDYGFDKAVDMLANLSAYRMIPTLIDAGDKALDEPGKAGSKYKKAMGFAKLVKDDHYINKIEKRLKKVNERINFALKKEEFEEREEKKVIELLKYNIMTLGKQETLMSVEDIRKYCNAKSNEAVIEVLVEMIQNKEIYAKFFPSSNRVMFDKDSNKDFLHFKNI